MRIYKLNEPDDAPDTERREHPPTCKSCGGETHIRHEVHMRYTYNEEVCLPCETKRFRHPAHR